MYEDYLENFVFKTARVIAKKLFGKEKKHQDSAEAIPETKEEQTNKEEEKPNLEESEQMMSEKLDEVLLKQKEEKAKQEKEQALARAEYDSITDGLSDINFHLPLFFLLLVITILSVPSVISWAKNYQYSRILSTDPYLLPATCSLLALAVIWQIAPRNV